MECFDLFWETWLVKDLAIDIHLADEFQLHIKRFLNSPNTNNFIVLFDTSVLVFCKIAEMFTILFFMCDHHSLLDAN